MMRTSLAIACLLTVALGWARPSQATLCVFDSKKDGTGKQPKWATMPVKYKINASKVAAADKAKFIAAVDAAFKAYEISCSSLKFQNDGETTSTNGSGSNVIVVNFSDQQTGSAYFTDVGWQMYDPADISGATIQMNIAAGEKWKYIVGKAASSIDIQTAVMQMIPPVIGFYAGSGDPKNVTFPEIKYNYENHTLSQEQKDGVLAVYFQAGAGCTKPTPPNCATMPSPDGGPKPGDGTNPTTDGGPKPTTEAGTNPTTDGSVATGDGTTSLSETSPLPPKDDEGGCCRVSHASSVGAETYLALVAVGLLLALRRRRR